MVRSTACGPGNPTTAAAMAEPYTAGNAANIPPIRPLILRPIKVAVSSKTNSLQFYMDECELVLNDIEWGPI
jgi:hypothetical protein